MSMATKLGSDLQCDLQCDVLSPIKSHDPLMAWPCDITSQTKLDPHHRNATKRPLTLAGRRLTVRGFYLSSYMTL